MLPPNALSAPKSTNLNLNVVELGVHKSNSNKSIPLILIWLGFDISIPTKSKPEYFFTAFPTIVVSVRIAEDQFVLQVSTITFVYELLNKEITSAAALIGAGAEVVGAFCEYPIPKVNRNKQRVIIFFIFILI